jgi:hypothetical protein
MRITNYQFFTALLLILSTGLFSQDSSVEVRNVKAFNIDSLKADSIRKDFIISHRPVSTEQLNLFKKPIQKSVYGKAVTSFIAESMYFKTLPGIASRVLTIKFRSALDWLFYSYVMLFLFLASILSISPEYIKVILSLLFRKGSTQDKSREAKLNTSIPSIMMNILFILSSSFFIYFTLSKIYGYNRLNPIGFILSCALVIAIFYLFKFLFLQLCGWLFKQKSIFEHYFSYLSLVNKAMGLILLVSSAFMAFGIDGFSGVVFTLSSVVLIGLLLLRVVNAFFIFSQPFKIGLPEFMIGFLSLEMLPTLVVLKFLQENSPVLLNGFL